MIKSLAIAALFGLLITGCGNVKEKAASAEAQKPTLEVTTEVTGTTATIHIKTALTLSQEHYGLERKAGEGHIHISLDDGEKTMITDKTAVFKDLSKGTHNVKVSLHNNDHTPYDVGETVAFEVK